MIFNISHGVGEFATITVTAKANTTVTCAQSPYSYSKNTDSGTTVSFVVPKSGTWSITATCGSITKSSTVSVTDYKGNYPVTFIFEYWIFKEGEGAKVSFTKDEGDYGKITIATDAITFDPRVNSGYQTLRTGNTAVDFTNYTKLYIETEYMQTSSLNLYLGGVQWFDNFDVKWYDLGDMDKHDRTLYSFDISSVTGKHGVVITAYSIKMLVYNVYLA